MKAEPVLVTINGVTQTLSYWAKQYKINLSVVTMRRKRSWPQAQWFNPVSSNNRRIT